MEKHGLNNEELAEIRAALKKGSRYRVFDAAPLELDKNECRAISRDILSNMRINGQMDMEHEYVLRAIYILGHATPNMVHDMLSWEKGCAGREMVPVLSVDKCKRVLSSLGRRGLVLSQQYRVDNHMVHIYTVTSYGFSLVRAVFGGSIPYDNFALYHSDKEIFKVLAVNAVTVEMAAVMEGSGFLVNGRYGGLDKYPQVKEHVYGAVESDGVMYIMEPAYFIPDKKIESELESVEKVGKRLLNVASICGTFVEKYQKKVRLMFVTENAEGSRQLIELLHGMDDVTGIYKDALITCENLFYASKGDLRRNFLRWTAKETDEKLQVRLMPVGDGWRKQ